MTRDFQPFIYYSSNHYLIPTFLSCYSLIKHYNDNLPINIIVEHNNWPQESINKMKSLEIFWKSKKKVSISFFNIDDLSLDIDTMQKNVDDQIRCRTCWGLAPETFFRLWIAKVTDASFAFSLDSDTIVVDDISSVWDFNLPADTYIMGAKHFADRSYEYNGWLEGRPNTYINSGVLLWNLDAIRKDNVINQFTEEIYNNTYLDQEIINRVCYGHIGTLPIEYNAGTPMRKLEKPRLNFSQDDIDAVRNHPKIIHYTSKWKPWITWVDGQEYYQTILEEVISNNLLTDQEYYNWRKTLEWPGVDKTMKVVD